MVKSLRFQFTPPDHPWSQPLSCKVLNVNSETFQRRSVCESERTLRNPTSDVEANQGRDSFGGKRKEKPDVGRKRLVYRHQSHWDRPIFARKNTPHHG